MSLQCFFLNGDTEMGEGPGLIKEISADYVTAWQQNMALDIKRVPFIPYV